MYIGQSIYEVETPALWVDLDIMEKNIRYMADYMKNAGVNWRPHTKGIKVPAVAHKLIQAGAIGITCAKLSEALVMANAGIRDILIANQIVGESKVRKLAAMQKHMRMLSAVDSIENAKEISEIAVQTGVKVPVLIEVNIGMNRAGVEAGQAVLDLAKQLLNLPGIDFQGIMGWEGHVVAIEDPQEKQEIGGKAIQSLADSAALLKKNNIPVEIVSCGGSGSYLISANVEGITEIQAGGAIFCDETYKKWGAETDYGLFLMTTVTSHTTPERALVDVGRKGVNPDISIPQPTNVTGVSLTSFSAEHGTLTIENANPPIKIGDKVNFTIGYGDWTVFLHKELIGVRNGKVEIVWEIQARGCLK